MILYFKVDTRLIQYKRIGQIKIYNDIKIDSENGIKTIHDIINNPIVETFVDYDIYKNFYKNENIESHDIYNKIKNFIKTSRLLKFKRINNV